MFCDAVKKARQACYTRRWAPPPHASTHFHFHSPFNQNPCGVGRSVSGLCLHRLFFPRHHHHYRHLRTMQIPITLGPRHTTMLDSTLPPPLVELATTGELILVELQGSLEFPHPSNPAGGQVLGKFVFEDGREDRPTLLISHHRLEGKFVNLTNPLAVLKKSHPSPSSHKDNEEEGEDQSQPRKKPRCDTQPDPPMSGYQVVTLVKRKILFSKRPEPVVRIDEAGAV
ncbi:hypothetical protein ACQY0O_000849 [Thecaphora frezii]